jgi:membrane-bound lytic murein transglycosylase B
LTLGTSLVTGLAQAGQTVDLSRPDVRTFISRMESEHGIPATESEQVLAGAEIQPRIIEAMSRPAEKVKPWHEYRAIFLTDKRIDAGVAFWAEHATDLARISEETGVAPEIIVGILGVETFFGRITGSWRVIDALATLAFEYPPRASFFTAELEQYLLLVREQRIDPLAATGSYAGAMGGPQFISSSYRAYAVDAGGDGRVDLWDDWTDIIGSVANYFQAHGWQPGGAIVAPVVAPVPEGVLSNGLKLDREVAGLQATGLDFQLPDDAGDKAMVFRLDMENGPAYWVGFRNFYVITRYNRSPMYAMAVYELGQEIAARRGDAGHGS